MLSVFPKCANTETLLSPPSPFSGRAVFRRCSVINATMQGFYMVGAVVLQIATGFARVRALEAKSNNFSLFHRVRRYFL